MNSIKIKLSYPVKFLTLPRKVGFLFTNLSMYLFREDNNLKDSKDLKDWVEKHTEAGLLQEMLYQAARAYCLENKQKENFTREGIVRALALTPQNKIQEILTVWQKSETFGATVKKKVIQTKTK